MTILNGFCKLLLLLAIGFSLFAQETVDNTNALRTAPFKMSPSVPGVGRLGDYYLNNSTYPPVLYKWLTSGWTVADSGAAAGVTSIETSVTDSQLTTFSGTTGGEIKASTLSGVLKATNGVPSAVSGTGSDCVKVDGTSGACGSGGGATSASSLLDLAITRTSGTVLTIGTNCSTLAPCNVRVGSTVYTFTASATATITAGTGTAYIYVSSAGTLTVGHNLTVTCSGCTSTGGVTSFPAESTPLWTWTATSTVWDASGGLDKRAFLSVAPVISSATLSVTKTADGVSIENIGNVIPVNAQTGTTYAITSANCGQLITFSNASAIAVSLPASPLADGCRVETKTIGVGDVTITPISGTISGAAAVTVSLGEFGIITSDGTDYEVETNRLVAGSGVSITKARIAATVAATGGGSGDVVGPASAVDSQLAAFDTTTGKLLKDSGLSSASTGTGDLVRATSPTLVTPALGTPSALVLTNATGLPLAGGGTGGTTAPTARGALGVTNVLTYVAGGGTTVADSTTYYHTWNNQAYQTAENSVSKLSLPVAGTITSLVLMASQNGATATSENVTVTLRINGSDTAITGTMAWDASSSNVNTGTFTGSVAVAAGDILSIKIVTPAWVTNPSNVRSIANVVLKMDQ